VVIDPAPQQTLVDMTTDPQNNLQQLLGDMLRNEASFNDFLGAQQGNGIAWNLVLNVMYLMVVLVLVWGYLVKYYRLWIAGHGKAEERYRLAYRAILDRLSALGYRRRLGESRESFAARMNALAPSFPAVTRHHLSLALGSRTAAIAEAQQLDWDKAGAEVIQEVRSKTPYWKKLLAILNPYSWLATR
jgi:hypothetical protein